MSEIVYINGNNALTTYGVSFPPSAINNIMALAPSKEYIENESRDEHGSHIIVYNPKYAKRELTIEMHINGASTTELLSRYDALKRIFDRRLFSVELGRQPGVVYHFIYESCNSFSMGERVAKYVLKLIEPNPENRT